MKLSALLSLAAALIGPQQLPTIWSKGEGQPGFEGLRAQIQRIVDTDRRSSARVNHLCFVVAEHRTRQQGRVDSSSTGLLYWRESEYIYALGPTAFPPLDDASLWDTGSIDLRTQVVARDRDVAGSTYLATRSVANGIISACRRHGQTYVVVRHA